MLRAALLLGLTAIRLAAADTNPDLILDRLRQQILTDLRRMPNYTCVEAVTREYFKPSFARPPASCDALAASKARGDYRLQRWSLDRLHLDVAVTPAREIYSWAGAQAFDDRELTDIIGGGPIGTGAFGAFLTSIFGSQGGATFTYVGETQHDGRPVLRYGYRVSTDNSHYQVRAEEGWIITSYDGDILVDPTVPDLVRLTIRTDELPPSTGSCETRTQMDYHRVTIGNVDFLLPRSTTQRFQLRNGIESENASTFSACREYRGESTLRFVGGDSAPTADPGAVTSSSARVEPIPGDLPVTMELIAPLDCWTASGGDTVPLRLAKPIVDSAKCVLVPAGASIHARLIRVQRYFTKPERVTVVVAPETIERAGMRLPFSVLPTYHQAYSYTGGFRWRGEALGEIPMPNEIKFGVFHFTGNHVILPKGYHTVWYTAPLATAKP
jgi:hypothetical protein